MRQNNQHVTSFQLWNILLLSTILLIGCGDFTQIEQKGLGMGESRIYSVDAIEMRNLVKIAATKAGYEIKNEKQYDPHIFGYTLEMSASFQSNGQYARVLIIDKGPKSTSVRFYNMKKIAMNITENLEGPKINFYSQLEALIVSKEKDL